MAETLEATTQANPPFGIDWLLQTTHLAHLGQTNSIIARQHIDGP